MVDVSGKPPVRRVAAAAGTVRLAPETSRRIGAGEVPKGNVLEAARAAALLAAKQTPHLLPHCHPIALTGGDVRFSLEPGVVRIEAEFSATDKTGVEMEALTAVCAAALTIYDMCKGIDKEIAIADVRLLSKSKAAP